MVLLVSVFQFVVLWGGGVSIVDGFNDIIRSVRFFLPAMWGVYALDECSKREQKVLLLFFVLIWRMPLVLVTAKEETEHIRTN